MVYEVEQEALEPSSQAVGIDLGVRKRMTLSDGTRVPRAQRDLRRQRQPQLALARCQEGSHTRRKRKAQLARQARREFVRERNACHRLTTQIIRQNGLIAVEKLQVRNMTHSARGAPGIPAGTLSPRRG